MVSPFSGVITETVPTLSRRPLFCYEGSFLNSIQRTDFVDWIGVDWIGVDWIGVDWIGTV